MYGATKLEGERAIAAVGAHALVLRTSWVYGLRGKNFLLTIRRLAAERDELRVVDDQIGVPNWSRALAAATARIVGAGLPALGERAGLYHLSCRGQASWYDFARAIVGDVARPRVVPIATADYPTPARRPAYGVLDTARFERTFGFALPDWREELADCLASLRRRRRDRPVGRCAARRALSERERNLDVRPHDNARPAPAMTIAFMPNVTPPSARPCGSRPTWRAARCRRPPWPDRSW